MSYSADWVARHITIPRSDLVLLSGDQYRLNLADFHKEMRRLEWGFVDGLWAAQVIEYVLPISVGGTDLAPVTTIINGYTFGFEEFIDPYSVELDGANSNLADVTIVNNVSIRPKNSAGLIIVNGECVDCNQAYEVLLGQEQLYTSQEGAYNIAVDDGDFTIVDNELYRVLHDDDALTVQVNC